MNRRTFLSTLPVIASARSLLASSGAADARVGICAFSCHQHWRAADAKLEGVKFRDALGFYRYCRMLGAEGVQVGLRSNDPTVAKAMRIAVEAGGGCYEADLRLPKTESDLPAFVEDVRLAREAGATVARAIFTGRRRYESFRTLDEFRAFHAQAEETLALVEPVARKHRLKIAVENHKDHIADELAGMMRALSSEWVGVLVDTGNNIALLDDPYAAVEALAPFALSVHFKDMAVRLSDDGFLLSEVPPGTGVLDLQRIVATLLKAKRPLVFNLEMATRDPLHIPCLTDGYFATFPERKLARLDVVMSWVNANPPKQSPPAVAGKPTSQILAEEEANNRNGLAWMKQHLTA